MNPKVSVILAVYNGELYLNSAIKSILNQTLEDFELIIINDDSQDKSLNIIESFLDKRIIIVNNDSNRGKSYGLNRGINISKGKYIVIMDQDDLALSNKLKFQYEFMEKNSQIGICGTQIQTFGDKTLQEGVGDTSNYPLSHHEIQLTQLYISPFAHPTVMIRKSVLEKSNFIYNENIIAEDYDLWSKLLLVTESANLNEVLLKYRIHASSITKTYFKTIEKERKVIRLNYCQQLFGLKNMIIPKLLYSGIPPIRIKAINYLVKNRGVFPEAQLLNHLAKLDEYFKSRNRIVYYINRLKSLLSI